MTFRIFILLAAFATVAQCDPRLRFLFYFESGTVQTTEFNAENFRNLYNHPSFRRNTATVLFHYGAGQTLSTLQVNDIITSYIFNRGYNFITVAYENNSTVGTDSAVDLSEGIASSLISLFDAGFNPGNINLLGFSLGAQILARASRRIQEISDRRYVVGRLTGLDPFNLGPISAIFIGRMSSADAQWVESIHTENPNRGDHRSAGHVQFYLNGGVSQPQCTSSTPAIRFDCSHNLALTYWAESVRATTLIFPALSCESWELYTVGECNSNSVGHMGRTTQSNLRGPYFLRTNLVAPFSRNTPLP